MIYLIQHRYTEYLNNKLEPKKESLSTFQHSLLNRRFNSHSHDSCWEQEEGALYSNNSLLKTSNEIINILANIFAMVHKPWSHTNQSLETNRLRLIKIQYIWYRVAWTFVVFVQPMSSIYLYDFVLVLKAATYLHLLHTTKTGLTDQPPN